jgi:RimJ/RimL family protein N-acetyltransferase
LNLNNADREKLKNFTKLPKLETNTIVSPTKVDIEPFLELYNLAKFNEPRGESTRGKKELNLENLVEVFNNDQYLSAVTLAWYDGIPAGISHFGLIESQKFIYQRFTGVHPNLCGKGIGTGVKASAILFVLNHYADFTHVETEILDENLPMIRVNDKLGFHQKQLNATVEFDL